MRGGEAVEAALRIERELDVFAARRAVRDAADAIGFGRRAREELAIVVSELATNILKYGVRGEIRLESIDDAGRGRGLRITACDVGPPIEDFATALVDGCAARGPIAPDELAGRRGIGGGLGAVQRLSDSLEYLPDEHGKRIRAVRFLVGKRR